MEELIAIARWTVAGILVVVFAACAIINPVLFVRRDVLRREHAPSLIPMVGGILGAWGLALVPDPRIARWAWLAPIMDFGTLPWLVVVMIKSGIDRIRGK
jgi:hypothetical protein